MTTSDRDQRRINQLELRVLELEADKRRLEEEVLFPLHIVGATSAEWMRAYTAPLEKRIGVKERQIAAGFAEVMEAVQTGIVFDAPTEQAFGNLGEIAEVLRDMKDKGVHRGAILYVVDRIWFEDEQREEAGR